MPAGVEVFDDTNSLAQAAADYLATSASDAMRRRGRFTVALSGGSTPKRLFSLLARPDRHARVPWHATHVFWSDERCVPPEHPDSNFLMAKRLLLDHVPVARGNIHRMRGELDATRAAQEYERELVGVVGKDGAVDLVLLGMGPDGHTASLFPDTAALDEMKRLVVANYVARLSSWRITLTYPALNAARAIVFLVAGHDKAEMVARAMAPPGVPVGRRPPAGRVQPAAGTPLWLLDRAAARMTVP